MLAPVPYGFAVEPAREVVAAAHRRIATVAGTWGLLHGDALADLKLCAAELAAHSFHEVGRPFTMRLSWTGRRARVEAADPSPYLPERPTPGTGLYVVAQIAAAWGAERAPAGRVMWFEIAPDPLDSGRRLAARIRAAKPFVQLGAVATPRAL